MDYNRGELVKLVHSIAGQYPPMVEELTAHHECLITHHITVRAAKNNMIFNRHALSPSCHPGPLARQRRHVEKVNCL